MANAWTTIDENIRKQIEKRQNLMLPNSNYKERVTYLNKKCDIRVTPLSFDITSPDDYVYFFFNNDYIENIFAGTSYKNQKERPFIENFEIINRTGGNDRTGVLRTGKMSIKIFTKDQFNKIEKYFRIGSALLIEWGWSNYVLNNTDNEIGNIGYFKDSLYKDFKNRSLNEVDILDHIKKQTLDSNGNYDGAIMFINNFSVNFENGVNDFYYTLNIDFIGKSLLMNELIVNKVENNSQTTDDTNKIFSIPLINLLRFIETIENKDKINNIVNRIDIDSDRTDRSESQKLILEDILSVNKTNLSQLTSSLFIPEKNKSQIEKSSNYTKSGREKQTFQTAIYSYNFIKLKYFLELINNNFEGDLVYNSLDYEYKLPQYNFPIIREGELSNLFPNLGTIFNQGKPINTDDLFKSFDTRVCILPHQIQQFSVVPLTLTKIGDILLRVTYLKDLLINLIKSKEKITHNDVVSSILSDINRITANEIKLEYSPIDEEYTIISNSSFEIKPDEKNNLLSLKIYDGSAVGSIAEEVNIDTTIDSKVASTVAIASQGRPLNDLSNESFGLLQFNKNIRSRFNYISTEIEITKNNLKNKLKKNVIYLSENSKDLLNFSDSSIDFDKNDIFLELINTYKQIRTDIINLSNVDPDFDTSRNTPLMPVLYSFSIPGISGLSIRNTLRIIDQRLPDIYQTPNSYYIITGVTHTINNREWKTSIKTNFHLGETDVPSRNNLFPKDSSEGSVDEQTTNNTPDISFDFPAFVNALQKIETGPYIFRSDSNIGEWRETSDNQNNWNTFPLFSRAGGDPLEVRARGPYQLKPSFVYDTLGMKDIIRNNERGRYEWKNTNILSQIDSVSLQQQAIENYQQKYLKNKKTYKRAAAIHYNGPLGAKDYSEVRKVIQRFLSTPTSSRTALILRNSFNYFEQTYWPRMIIALGIDRNSLIDNGQPNGENF